MTAVKFDTGRGFRKHRADQTAVLMDEPIPFSEGAIEDNREE
jgi:hypothetical protein